jgi:hypothetical protein
VAEKGARTFGLRGLEDLLRGPVFDNGAALEHHDRSATRREKVISWVTTTIVMPSSANCIPT